MVPLILGKPQISPRTKGPARPPGRCAAEEEAAEEAGVKGGVALRT